MHLSRIDHRPENSIAAPATLHVNVFQAVPCGRDSRQFGPEHGKIFPTPRWLAFGLQMPATITTPGKPVNVTAMVDDTGTIIVQCDAMPLATRYRWRMLVVGVEVTYRLVARSVDPMGMITGVMPGQTAQIIVQAVNGDLQGVEILVRSRGGCGIGVARWPRKAR